MIVFKPVPSHTIIKGANADLGRLFNTISMGSKIFPSEELNQNNVAKIKAIKIIRKKLTVDSTRVIVICFNSEKSNKL